MKEVTFTNTYLPLGLAVVSFAVLGAYFRSSHHLRLVDPTRIQVNRMYGIGWYGVSFFTLLVLIYQVVTNN